MADPWPTARAQENTASATVIIKISLRVFIWFENNSKHMGLMALWNHRLGD